MDFAIRLSEEGEKYSIAHQLFGSSIIFLFFFQFTVMSICIYLSSFSTLFYSFSYFLHLCVRAVFVVMTPCFSASRHRCIYPTYHFSILCHFLLEWPITIYLDIKWQRFALASVFASFDCNTSGIAYTKRFIHEAINNSNFATILPIRLEWFYNAIQCETYLSI